MRLARPPEIGRFDIGGSIFEVDGTGGEDETDGDAARDAEDGRILHSRSEVVVTARSSTNGVEALVPLAGDGKPAAASRLDSRVSSSRICCTTDPKRCAMRVRYNP
jgi:hypothetical protein